MSLSKKNVLRKNEGKQIIPGFRIEYLHRGETVKDYGRKKAIEHMDKIRKEANIHMTDAEIRKARDFGRE